MFARIGGLLFLVGGAALLALAGVLLALWVRHRSGQWASASAGEPLCSTLSGAVRLFGIQAQILDRLAMGAAGAATARACGRAEGRG